MFLGIKINYKLGTKLKLDTLKAVKIENKFLNFFCSTSIKMNLKLRKTSKNSSIRALRSKTVRLRKKVIQELKDLIYKQKEKNKSNNINIYRTFNRIGLKGIGKRQNLSNKNVNKVKI